MRNRKVAPRITISVPPEIRAALQEHVESQGKSESGFVAELLKRVLNVGKNGMSAERSDRLFELMQLLSLFSTSGKTADSLEAASESVVHELQQGDYQRGDLNAAVPWFLLALLGNPERMSHAIEGQDVYMPRVDYLPREVQEALIALTFHWNKTRLFGLNFKPLRPAMGAFDAIINLEFALSSKTIFPFPCFQTEFRRPLFGLVPYGHHVAVGWLVHKDNPLANVFQLNGTFKRDAMLVTAAAAATRLQFLSELFNHVSQGEIALFTKDNYLNREMLPLLKSNAQHGLLVSAFSVRKFATIVTDDSQWPSSEGSVPARKNCVLLYDLAADKDLVQKSQDQNFVPIPFLHDQTIPVGIGFSLPTLPFMAREIDSTSKKTVAETLREVVQKTTKNDAVRFEREFWSGGILLDADLRTNAQETDAQFSERMCNGNTKTKTQVR